MGFIGELLSLLLYYLDAKLKKRAVTTGIWITEYFDLLFEDIHIRLR